MHLCCNVCSLSTLLAISTSTGRGQEALDKKQSIEDGLTAEESYFSNTEPWRGVEDKNLFGTKNLRIKLASCK